MSKIDYTHFENFHTLEGPRVALPVILEMTKAKTLLDVGCGTGTWLKSALELGISDIFGVDGVRINPEELLIPVSIFKVQDFTQTWRLDRKYDLALCLEVAEHLDERFAPTLIDSLVSHADTIVFSAACPGQEGQHHVNGQWPGYWQKLFNDCGFTCSDELRWRLWQDARVEPWYRQNIFIARRAGAALAGREQRIKSVVHPDIVSGIINTSALQQTNFIKDGGMPLKWYLKLPFTALRGRLKRKSSD
jgi:Methyltransferase domain